MFRRVIVAVFVLALAQLAVGQTLEPMTTGVIPVVAHLPGAEGSLWRTDLSVVQPGGDTAARLDLTLANPGGTDWTTTVTTPGPRGSMVLSDVVAAIDSSVPNGKYVLTWTSTEAVVVTSRTYTVEDEGSYGQGIGSLEPGSGFGTDGEVMFPGPMDSDTHRVNVGIANSGGSGQTFAISALDAAGAEIDSWQRTVAAGAIVQLKTNDLGEGAGSVMVKCESGCDGTAFGYLSVVVNDSNDAYFQYSAAEAGTSTVTPVSTVRDDKGVWYITGGTLADVFEAEGYAVATDRLWQMELYRRNARGTLAEVLGSDYLESDMLARTVGYSDSELQAELDAINAESRAAIRGYVRGVNQRIAEVTADPSQLPFEFHAVGQQLGTTFVPAPWTALDVVAWISGLLRNFDPEATAMGQMDNAELMTALSTAYGQLGQAMFADLRWVNDPAAQTMIPAETMEAGPRRLPDVGLSRLGAVARAAREMRRIRAERDRLMRELGAQPKMGSYAWVVSGDKTASGDPILYSGPQMGFDVPSIVTEGSIVGGGLQVSGMTVPGIPAIIIGRTPHHAWSMQVGHAHTTDYYLEAPQSVTLHRVETIHVAGGDDVDLPVYRTAHGPVVYPVPYDPSAQNDTIVSWKYAHWGYEAGTIGAFLDLIRAQSMDEFSAGIEQVAVSQHFCYADRDGNIAYWMSGMDPVRPDGVDSRFPLMGDGTEEWPQPVTLKPRAHDRNTSQGYYGGWNNKAKVDYDNAPNNLSYIMGVAHRAHVIGEYLSAHDDLTYEQVRDLALNIATTDSFGGGGNTWSFVADDFSAAVQADPTQARQDAVAMLDSWDGHFVDGGESEWVDGLFRADAWVLQDAWVREMLRLTFEDEFATAGLEWDDQPMQLLFNVLLHALAGSGSSVVNLYDWFQDQSGAGKPTTADALIVLALDNTLAALGDQPWLESRGRIRYVHPILGEVSTTPFASRSTYAHCVQFGDTGPTRIESMFPLGESGTILMGQGGVPVYDDHFFSMKPVFDAFAPRPFPLFD